MSDETKITTEAQEPTPAQTRATMIEQKRKAGLRKDQAEAVVDAQLEQDAAETKKNKTAKARK